MVRLCTPRVPAAGLRDGAHYWRVRAVNGSDAVAGREVGDWSEGWAFTVGAPSPTERKLYLPVVVRDHP